MDTETRMTPNDFDKFWRRRNKDLVNLLIKLKKHINTDMLQEGDTLPSIQITISVDKLLSDWNYQTGDNSYSGGCYGDPYWGVGSLYRRTNCKQLAKDLIEDLANQINFNN